MSTTVLLNEDPSLMVQLRSQQTKGRNENLTKLNRTVNK